MTVLPKLKARGQIDAPVRLCRKSAEMRPGDAACHQSGYKIPNQGRMKLSRVHGLINDDGCR